MSPLNKALEISVVLGTAGNVSGHSIGGRGPSLENLSLSLHSRVHK